VTKKEIIVIAVCAVLIVILMFLPLLIAYAGTAAVGAQAFTADENSSVYLAAGRQIRVISPDNTVMSFRAPLNGVTAIETDGQTIRVFSGRSFAVVDKSGSVVERGRLDDREAPEKQSTVIQGGVTYRYKSVLGFYRITQETAGKETVRYRMPLTDVILRLIGIAGILLFAPFCAGVPLYFMIHKRVAKDGTILPPQAQG